MVPGLFLALAGAFLVLAINKYWLFPALDETGVLYLSTAPELAAGAPPVVPVASWDAAEPVTGLDGQGTLMPLLMAGLVRTGAQPHVAGLWLMAAGLGGAAFAVSWVVGGVAGISGGVAAGLLLLVVPVTRDAATILGPDTLLTALVALLLAVMTYQPRWFVVHGILAALAWLSHPAGAGVVAAVAAWAGFTGGATRERLIGVVAALAPAAVLLAVGVAHPLLSPAGLSGWGFDTLGRALGGVAHWAGAGLGRVPGGALGAGLLAAGAFLVVLEALVTPEPPTRVHWSDPAAPDVLGRSFRPAAGILALGTLLGAAAAGSVGSLDRPWLPTTLLLAALAAAAAVRWPRRLHGIGAWAPLVLLGLWAGLAGWRSGVGLARFRAEGRGVTAMVWVESSIIRWLDNYSAPYRVIYATDPMLVFLQTGRAARGMPPAGASLDGFLEAWRGAPGPLVLTGRAQSARERELQGSLGVQEVVSAPEGRILVPRGGP